MAVDSALGGVQPAPFTGRLVQPEVHQHPVYLGAPLVGLRRGERLGHAPGVQHAFAEDALARAARFLQQPGVTGQLIPVQEPTHGGEKVMAVDLRVETLDGGGNAQRARLEARLRSDRLQRREPVEAVGEVGEDQGIGPQARLSCNLLGAHPVGGDTQVPLGQPLRRPQHPDVARQRVETRQRQHHPGGTGRLGTVADTRRQRRPEVAIRGLGGQYGLEHLAHLRRQLAALCRQGGPGIEVTPADIGVPGPLMAGVPVVEGRRVVGERDVAGDPLGTVDVVPQQALGAARRPPGELAQRAHVPALRQTVMPVCAHLSLPARCSVRSVRSVRSQRRPPVDNRHLLQYLRPRSLSSQTATCPT